MVVFDTSILALAFDEDANPPTDPATNELLTDCQVRIDYLIKSLSKTKTRVLIPTPVMAEYLVRAGLDKDKRLSELTSSRVFVVAAFDIRAAVECAGMEDADYLRLRAIPESETKTKVKFDRQIIATAIARGASAIYTGDIKLAARAKRNNIEVVMTWELPLPPAPLSPADPQLKLEYGSDDGKGVQPSLAASPVLDSV